MADVAKPKLSVGDATPGPEPEVVAARGRSFEITTLGGEELIIPFMELLAVARRRCEALLKEDYEAREAWRVVVFQGHDGGSNLYNLRYTAGWYPNEASIQ